MPKASDAVTVSARKKYLFYFALICAFIIGVVAWFLLQPSSPKLTVNGKQYVLEIKDTDAERQQGLSGRDSLPPSNAMLFSFDNHAQRCFWMKDMKFDIDIVWLDESKKVVALEQSVQPSSYPQNFCHDGKYVAEFVAGTAKTDGISKGSQFNF